jgi:DNA repair exonuclease SbcCD ATPase subunit
MEKFMMEQSMMMDHIGESEEGTATVEQPEVYVMTIQVFADSKKAAQDDAKTVVYLLRQLIHAPMEMAEQEQRKHRERIEQSQSEIAELERKHGEIDREIKEHKKTVYFSTKTDTKRSILEWTDLLNTIEVDLVGIKARLKKIQELDEQTTLKPASESLRVMRLAAEVDLASALARKGAAVSFRQKAIDFCELMVDRDHVASDIANKQKELTYSRNAVTLCAKWLAAIQAENIQPVEVVDNEVIIHPVSIN